MRNPNPNELCLDDDGDDSWEVRAFAEDTRNIMNTTWPPRSYTCIFCRREFRSAQALGGHMNVHRQDRARLHLAPSPRSVETSSSSTSKVVIPSPGFLSNGHGLSFLYHLSNPSCRFSSTPSTLLSMSPCQPDNPTFSFTPSTNFPTKIPQICSNNVGVIKPYEPLVGKFSGGKEELDLELRLGQRPTPS